MRKHLITLLIALMTIGASAQQANGTYSFLRATNSARVAALGGLPLPIADHDIQLSTFNPAAIDSAMSNKMGLSYVDYYTDINFATLQYARTFEKVGSFAATVQYHNYGHFDETSESGVVTGEFGCSDFSVNLGWGRALTPHWNIGAAMKYAGIQYESYSAGALAFDVAGMYHTDNGWTFSLNARNIGIQLFNNINSERDPLPFSLDFGASRKLEHLPVTVMLWYDDIQHWNKFVMTPTYIEKHTNPITGEFEPESKVSQFARNLFCHVVVGGELTLGKNIVLRGAFDYGQRYAMDVPQNRTLVGFSAGLAVKIKMFEISYARSRNSIVMSPNYLTITMDLNKF
ncbi:MAG: type IX secretion system protein PorQ [Bacteroidales bacterium]|nr:type IX secretion system protein PorQ [Bacteroidales bacterium]